MEKKKRNIGIVIIDTNGDEGDASRVVPEDASTRRYTYHTPDVFDPPTTFSERLKRIQSTFLKSLQNAYKYWEAIRRDPYKWQLFKSAVFFTIGLKLFRDIAKHAEFERLKE